MEEATRIRLLRQLRHQVNQMRIAVSVQRDIGPASGAFREKVFRFVRGQGAIENFLLQAFFAMQFCLRMLAAHAKTDALADRQLRARSALENAAMLHPLFVSISNDVSGARRVTKHTH